MNYGRPYVLVRWTGLDAAGDTCEPLDNLTNCEDAIAASEQAVAPSPPCAATANAHRHSRSATDDPADRLHGRGGAARRPGRSTGGPKMTGSAALSLASTRTAPSCKWWPTPGRRRRCAARRTRFSTPPPSAPAGCFSRRPQQRVWTWLYDPGHLDPKFEVGRWLVAAPGPGPRGQLTFA